jgi:hypothetical protein
MNKEVLSFPLELLTASLGVEPKARNKGEAFNDEEKNCGGG